MSGALAVASREISGKRTIFVAALVAGLLPFASPLFPGVRADRWAEARDLMAVVLATAFAVGTAVVAGATAVARDLSERRLGFDFSRPLGAGAIWSGRFLGAVSLTLLVLALVLLPTSLVGGGVFSKRWSDPEVGVLLLAGLGALLLVIPLVHAASVALRSRSGWLGVDLVAAVVFLLLVASTIRRLVGVLAYDNVRLSLGTLAVLVVPVFWIASAVQVAVGRTDLRRGHRVLSITLWSGLLALAAAHFAYGAWVVGINPRDLARPWGSAAPRGSWAIVSGTARGSYGATMLVDTASGRFVRLGPSNLVRAFFSDDGRRVLFLRSIPSRDDAHVEVLVADLGTAKSALRETTLSVPRLYPMEAALSGDGSRLAVVDGDLVSAYDVDSGRTLAAVRLPARDRLDERWVYFDGDDRVRIVTSGRAITLHELDLVAKRVEKTGGVETGFTRTFVEPATGGGLLAHDDREEKRALLLDGRSGAVLATYAGSAAAKAATFRPLLDGRVAAIERIGDEAVLRVLAQDGHELRSIPLGSRLAVMTGAESPPGHLVLATAPRGAEPNLWPKISEYSSILVDLDEGTTRGLARGVTPIQSWGRGFGPAPSPGGASAVSLFRGENGLYVVDPTTGARRLVAGREESAPAR